MEQGTILALMGLPHAIEFMHVTPIELDSTTAINIGEGSRLNEIGLSRWCSVPMDFETIDNKLPNVRLTRNTRFLGLIRRRSIIEGRVLG